MSKQLRLASDLFGTSPLRRATVGFDDLIDTFFNNYPALASETAGYPPFNIRRLSVDGEPNSQYEIVMAVAGFTREDITVTLERQTLTVSGAVSPRTQPEGTTVEYLYKGLAERSFRRVWQLPDHMEVSSAELVDGMLTVKLERIVPEQDLPKQIPVK